VGFRILNEREEEKREFEIAFKIPYLDVAE